jgi:acylphosphatase
MNSAQEPVRVCLNVLGRVQGVFFRASTVARAHDLGLTGWVRNRDDGAVEVVAEGARAEVERLIEWCRRGPPGAQVQRVEIEWQTFQNEFGRFNVKR